MTPLRRNPTVSPTSQREATVVGSVARKDRRGEWRRAEASPGLSDGVVAGGLVRDEGGGSSEPACSDLTPALWTPILDLPREQPLKATGKEGTGQD